MSIPRSLRSGMGIPHLGFLFEGPQHQSRRQGHSIAHRLDLRHRSPSFSTIPNSIGQKTGEDGIPDQSGRTPLLPKSGSLDSLSPNTIGEEQVGKTVVEPMNMTNRWIIGIPDRVRRVISDIARSEHDLCAQWSITVASETCLCPKSYLIGSWIGSSRIPVNKGRVGGDGASDLPRRSLTDSTRGITKGRGTRCETLRGRHLW